MAPKAGKPKAPARMVTKDIGGDKNGKQRTVRAQRLVRDNLILVTSLILVRSIVKIQLYDYIEWYR